MIETLTLAQEATTTTGGLEEWLNYGVAGLVVACLVLGWLIPGPTHRREIERADRLEAENARIQEAISERTVPLLTRAVVALERLGDHEISGP